PEMIGPELFQLRSRSLKERAIGSEGEQTWQGQTTVPSVAGLKSVNPAPHDPATMPIRHTGGSVIIPSVIELRLVLRFEPTLPQIDPSDKLFDRPMRRDHQDPPLSHLEKIGALDVETLRIRMRKEPPQIPPLGQTLVLGTIEEHNRLPALSLIQVS